jgi:RNA polymerase sigma-70 factor, ECF subfamily
MKADEVLMEELKAGNPQAFDLIIYRYEKTLLNYLYRWMGNFHQSEDLCQEVFLRVYKSAMKFNSEQKFSSWLYRIANNLCIDEYRKNKNVIKVDIEDIELPSSENIEEKVEKNEIEEKVKKAVMSLPQDHRTVLILKHYQGLSYNEISEILGCPLGTVKSRIHYALIELRKTLDRNNITPQERSG